MEDFNKASEEGNKKKMHQAVDEFHLVFQKLYRQLIEVVTSGKFERDKAIGQITEYERTLIKMLEKLSSC